LGEIRRQRNVLMEELGLLKDCQKHEEMTKLERDNWDKEREKLKEEKKKIEYMLYDLLKASEGNKEKLERIKVMNNVY
jgi:hypothetical protein